ncbi:transposase [Pseudogracilibacillus sp. SO30301A]|uniref:transposase n=1 Tax=Pseudogracilibacillus sp. SO30301A TaxID=3098291 RepID=UPI00300E48D8
MEIPISYEERGKEKGHEEGLQKGLEKGKQKVVLELLKEGVDTISKTTELNFDEIEKMKQQI